MFANMYDAYEALSDSMKATFKDVKTWCVGDRRRGKSGDRASRYVGNAAMAAKVQTPVGQQTESAHPLFRTHPETRRTGLYFGSHVQRLEGFSDAEVKMVMRDNCEALSVRRPA